MPRESYTQRVKADVDENYYSSPEHELPFLKEGKKRPKGPSGERKPKWCNVGLVYVASGLFSRKLG